MYWPGRSNGCKQSNEELAMVAGRRTSRKKRKATVRKPNLLARVDVKAFVLALFILSFLLFTLGALVYVVFFQTVIVIEHVPDMYQFMVRLSIDTVPSAIGC